MVILATISIYAILGENGLIKKAQESKEVHEQAKVNEQIGIDQLAEHVESYIPREQISTTDSFVGYYADIEGDGTVDGIIYADKLRGNTKSGNWNGQSYEVDTITDSKDYYVSKKDHTGSFGTKDVISPIKTSEGEGRFYIMALNDITTNGNEEDGQYLYYWYYNAYGQISDYEELTEVGFGKGKTNTENVSTAWNAQTPTYGERITSSNPVENKVDIWGVIGQQIGKGWFIPSKDEWAAFAGELEITAENYSGKGLSNKYWTTSLVNDFTIWGVEFGNANEYWENIAEKSGVRLSTTF